MFIFYLPYTIIITCLSFICPTQLLFHVYLLFALHNNYNMFIFYLHTLDIKRCDLLANPLNSHCFRVLHYYTLVTEYLILYYIY